MLVMNRKKNSRNRKPSNILLWVITVYTAFFSLAFQKYENHLNRLYTSYNSYIDQLGNNSSKDLLDGFIEIQSRTVPYEPN